MGKPWQDRDTLQRLYWDENLKQAEIAERIGCDPATVSVWMSKLDIETKPSNRRYESEPWRDRDTLQRLYWEDELTQPEIAEKLGCNLHSVQRWMDRLGVKARDNTERNYLRYGHEAKLYKNPDGYMQWQTIYHGERYEAYVHRLLAVSEYGFEAVSGKVVHHKNGVKWDNRPSNIEILTNSEHGDVHNGDPDAPWKYKGLLKRAYERHTLAELAEVWGTNESRIWRWMQKHGLETRGRHDKPNPGPDSTPVLATDSGGE